MENQNQQLTKMISNKSKKNIKKIFSPAPKLPIIKAKIDVKFKFQKLSLNSPFSISSQNENTSKIYKILNLFNKSNTKNNHATIESQNLHKKERSQKVKNFLDQLRRKPNNYYQKSFNTNLKLYEELLPGPGHYNINKNDISSSHNLRYKNLYKNDSKKQIISNNYYIAAPVLLGTAIFLHSYSFVMKKTKSSLR